MLKKTIRTTIFLCCLALSVKGYADELEDLLNGQNQENSITTDTTSDDVKKTRNFKDELQRTFYIAAANGNLDLNPHTSSYSSEAQIINALQEGLFNYDPKTLDPIPALAQSYRISRDKKRWTFTIREGASQSDGKPITAQTFVDSWLLLQKTANAPYASLLDCISGIKDYREKNIPIENVGLKARGQTLIVTLNSPTAHLPSLLCHHAFAAFTGNQNVFSGAYKLTQATSEGLTLEKNESYWDKDNVALKTIQMTFSESEIENTWLFNTGATDWVMGSVKTDSVLNKNSIRLSAVFGTSFLFFTCKNPIWDNSEFRTALLTAIPWEKLRKDNLIHATTLVYPLSGYPNVEGLSDYSADEALEMMSEARKNAHIDEQQRLELTFGITSGEYMKKLAEVLKEAWAPLGVDLVTYRIEDDRYFSSIPYLNYDMFTYSWIGDFADPLAFLELFREGSTLNQTKWKNEEFNNLLKLSDEQTSPTERYKLLSKAEQLLLDSGIIIPISHSVSLHAINLNKVGGWYTNALDIHPFKYIYIKEYEEEIPANIVMR